MSIIKKLLKPRVIIWAATTVVLTGVLIAADYFAMNKYVKLIEATELGGDTPIPDPNQKGNAFVAEFDTKDKAFDNANKVTKEIWSEAITSRSRISIFCCLTDESRYVKFVAKFRIPSPKMQAYPRFSESFINLSEAFSFA